MTIQKLSPRASALDALRGIAIMLMVLSGLEPFGVLPSWMYHGQEPPPTHIFNPNIAGITWVDLVFPFFIFSMGAAFPIAFSKRIAAGFSNFQLIRQIIKRGFLLLAFAIYNQHFNPQIMSNNPNAVTCILALAAFFLMFAIWGQFSWQVNVWFQRLFKWGAVFIVILLFIFLKYPDGQGFSLFRSNIILFILANLAVFGSLLWLFTRNNITWRLVLMGFFLAVYISNSVETSWIHIIRTQLQIPFIAKALKQISPWALDNFKWLYDITWMFNWSFMKYLFIIVPATIIGEMLEQNLKLSNGESPRFTWSRSIYVLISLVMMFFVIIVLVGLKMRFSVFTFMITAILCLAASILFGNPGNDFEKMLTRMYFWGVLWLNLGLLFEPYEGGIKKDPSTLSYYFVCAGLAIFVMIAFIIIFDVFKKEYMFKTLIGCGQNPMIAYVSSLNLLLPILGILGLASPLQEFGQKMPWLGFFIAVCFTCGIAFMVSIFSRYKIYLRT